MLKGLSRKVPHVSAVAIAIFASLLLPNASDQTSDLDDAQLNGANLSGVDLTDADLNDLDLTEANLQGATPADVDPSDTDLCGATLPNGSVLEEGC
ncbi:MAG: pentapeptide repeat-containing protein [Elainellaceae cyanobacterium]